MVSVKFHPRGGFQMRVNQAFLSAPEAVISALGHYLQTRSRSSWKEVCNYVATLTPDPKPSLRVTLATQGRIFDLQSILDRINQIYFEDALDCRITWSRAGRVTRRARTRTIRYGSFNKSLNLIRINPLLDDPRVPPEFLDYIVFHELLHALVPSERRTARWRHHHGSFALLERRYPDHARMKQMASDLVGILPA